MCGLPKKRQAGEVSQVCVGLGFQNLAFQKQFEISAGIIGRSRPQGRRNHFGFASPSIHE